MSFYEWKCNDPFNNAVSLDYQIQFLKINPLWSHFRWIWLVWLAVGLSYSPLIQRRIHFERLLSLSSLRLYVPLQLQNLYFCLFLGGKKGKTSTWNIWHIQIFTYSHHQYLIYLSLLLPTFVGKNLQPRTKKYYKYHNFFTLW